MALEMNTALQPFLLLVLMSLVGCETSLDIEFPEHQPELVIYGLFEPEAPWRIQVLRTEGLDERVAKENTVVTNARIAILQDGREVASPVHVGRGVYVAEGVFPEAGLAYTIEVSAEGYPVASATSQIPASNIDTDILFSDSTRVDPETNTMQADITLSFNDPSDQQNYYFIEVQADLGSGPFSISYSSNDPVLLNTQFGTVFGKENDDPLVFDDATFDGSTFETTIRVEREFANSYGVQLVQSTEAYYRYVLSLAQIRSVEDNPFAEPVRPISNVEQGQGIFAGIRRSPQAQVLLDEINLEVISGSYVPLAFLYQSADTSFQLSPDQAQLNLTLMPDGRVTGNVFIQGAFNMQNPGQNLDTDLEGQFSYDGRRVRFSLTPETFINQLSWSYSQDRLQSDQQEELDSYFLFMRRVDG